MNEWPEQHPGSTLVLENVKESAPEARQNLVKSIECYALLQILQPMKSRRRNAEFPGELSVGGVALSFSKERGELLVELTRHRAILPKPVFRMRNKCVDAFRIRNNITSI